MKKLLLQLTALTFLLFPSLLLMAISGEQEHCQATLPILELEANPDIVAVLPTESITFNVLENDIGEGIFIKGISKQPLCGSVEVLDTAMGEVRYSPDVGCLLNVINFEYEVEDIEGNTAIAEVKVVMNREGSELVVGIERDCSNALETLYYTVTITIVEGIAPFTISGTLNQTLENHGTVNVSLLDGNPYEIHITDASGNTFNRIAGANACDTWGMPYIFLNHISEIGTCLCDGSIIIDFENLNFGEEISEVSGYWWYEENNKLPISMGDTIPNNAFFSLNYINFEPIHIVLHGFRLLDTFEGFSDFPSNFCTPETYTLQTTDDFANTLPNEPVTINLLQNDTDTNLQINAINLAPTCGEITDLNPETGEVVYIPNADTECTVDVFVYEVVDECGNLEEATVTIFIEQKSELFVEVERDCSNVEETGLYTLNVAIFEGTPPYIISGSINETLNETGSISTLIEDGNPYDIFVIDAEENEFFETGGDVSCNAICGVPTPLYIEHISTIANCTCNGDLIFHFDSIELMYQNDVVTAINTFSNSEKIESGDTIPNNGTINIGYIVTHYYCFEVFYLGEQGINSLVSDLCTSETYNIKATDDTANISPSEPVTVNVLTNDTGTNLQLGGIIFSPSCGEIVDINLETGDMVYVADADTNCSVDSFVYEVVDECGNTSTATVTINIEQPIEPLDLQLERFCTNQFNLETYLLHATISGGVPPYTLSGCINEAFDSETTQAIYVNSCHECALTLTDAEGNQDYETISAICFPIVNQAESRLQTCGEPIEVILRIGGEQIIYHWYLDAALTIPANPPTGQVWTNNEIIGMDTLYVIASRFDTCLSEPLAIEIQRFEEISITPSYDCLITETQDSIALLSYQATGGDGNYTFNGNSQNDTLQNGDIFQIEVIDGNGCTTMVSDTINCEFTSITNSEYPISNIHLFPNPNDGSFTLNIETQHTEMIDIEILDITGRTQAKTRRRLENTATFERHEDLPSGLYFIRVSGKGWTWTEKMVVE